MITRVWTALARAVVILDGGKRPLDKDEVVELTELVNDAFHVYSKESADVSKPSLNRLREMAQRWKEDHLGLAALDLEDFIREAENADRRGSVETRFEFVMRELEALCPGVRSPFDSTGSPEHDYISALKRRLATPGYGLPTFGIKN